MPQISVIVPVYNVEGYLGRCIESVLSQSFSDWELLLIDDGSTDQGGKICDTYEKQDKRIRVIHKQNEGVSSARNLGLSMAKGDYIAFVDGDDWIAEKYLENLYDCIIKNKVDVAVCGGCEISEEGRILRELPMEACAKMQPCDPALYDWPHFTYVIHRMMARKGCVQQLKFDCSIANGEDALFLTELYVKAKHGVCFTPYLGYYYLIRQSGAAQHHTYSPKKFSAIIAMQKRLETLEKAEVPMQQSWYDSFVVEAYRLYSYIVRNQECYQTAHAMCLYQYLKKYNKHSRVLGESVYFRVKYKFMLGNRRIMEYELEKRELPLPHIMER